MTDPTPTPDPTPEPTSESTPNVHLYVMLDRSGSMATMADDVIGGFNRLLADQKADGADAIVTLVQFDGNEPQEIIADAVPISEMVDLDHNTFVPRGSTPLLDATGMLLGRASSRVSARRAAGLADEEILIVSITDGHENSSSEYSLATINQSVAAHQEAGWTFGFLSAALDVYGEAGGLGYDHRSVQSWTADGDGATIAMDSLSMATTELRRTVRTGETFNKRDFFKGRKLAEDDRRRRTGE